MPARPTTALPRHLMFGAAYYHEYNREDRLERDLDLMVAAHMNVIRVGESVWSTWEPRNGVFDLEWLAPVLAGAHTRGIDVVLGTPTYAIPPWLARTYPEIAGERRTGERIGWGARQEVDFTHPAFRFHAERVVRQILGRYAAHPAVVGFQVDNEPGLELFHNHGVFQRFVDGLEERYGDVENLNREWGLVYWSHRLSTWADLWTPDGNAQPQYDLAWRRFQREQTDELIAWQAAVVAEYAGPEQFVTTCISYERPAVDDETVCAALDVASGNPYYSMQDDLALPDDRALRQGWKTWGTWALFLTADRMWSSRQAPFLVTETDAGHVGQSWDNRPAYDGQWRQCAWALVARGARMIEYWQWHSLPFGAETYWGGVLPHALEPGRTFRELANLGAELHRAGDLLDGAVPQADVTLLYSTPTKWLMQDHPVVLAPDATGDPDSYRHIVDPFYRGAFDAGLQVRIVHAHQLLDTHEGPGMPVAQAVTEHPVLVVAAFYLADDESLRWLDDYARAGGHLVLGPRTAYADREARARPERMPAGLRSSTGASYDEFSNLADPLTVVGTEKLRLDADAQATRWVDGWETEDAEVLAAYEHPHFGRWPAVTTNPAGAGRVTAVGTVPNPSFARSLFQHLVPDPVAGWSQLPPSVTVSTLSHSDGTRIHVLHNWSWTPQQLTAQAAFHGLSDAGDATGVAVQPGQAIELGAWDVVVLVEEPGPTR